MAFVFAIAGFMAPIWLLYFQKKMRQLEMEDEVMQFETIILMLMRIERVNVEIILEWLERYSNIFYEQISKCVNPITLPIIPFLLINFSFDAFLFSL